MCSSSITPDIISIPKVTGEGIFVQQNLDYSKAEKIMKKLRVFNTRTH